MNSNKNYFSLKDKDGLENILKCYCNELNGIVNVIMEPYKSEVIVREIIERNKKDKILCLTNNLEITKSKFNNVSFNDLDNWMNNPCEYDVIIIDDLSSYSDYSKLDFIEIIDYFYKRANKVVIFSIEEIFSNCKSIYVTTQDRESHFIEPRIIISKLNLKKKLPDIVMQYFEYFNRLGDNTIIYVGKNETDIFYDNLNKYLYIFNDIKIYKDVNNYKIISLILEKGNQIIITEEIDKVIDKIENSNFIVYSASKDFFTYKKIVFICGRLSLLEKEKEMIIVSKQDSSSIDISKDITRCYNKIVWE